MNMRESFRKKKTLMDYLKLDNFIIGMNNTWKTFFDTFVLFVVAYSIFTTLLYVSFEVDPDQPWERIDQFVFYVFTADFVLSKFHSYLILLNRFHDGILRSRDIQKGERP